MANDVAFFGIRTSVILVPSFWDAPACVHKVGHSDIKFGNLLVSATSNVVDKAGPKGLLEVFGFIFFNCLGRIWWK
jgi:hypothetical protein